MRTMIGQILFDLTLTLKARYDLHCVESAVKLQPTNLDLTAYHLFQAQMSTQHVTF